MKVVVLILAGEDTGVPISTPKEERSLAEGLFASEGVDVLARRIAANSCFKTVISALAASISIVCCFFVYKITVFDYT